MSRCRDYAVNIAIAGTSPRRPPPLPTAAAAAAVTRREGEVGANRRAACGHCGRRRVGIRRRTPLFQTSRAIEGKYSEKSFLLCEMFRATRTRTSTRTRTRACECMYEYIMLFYVATHSAEISVARATFVRSHSVENLTFYIRLKKERM